MSSSEQRRLIAQRRRELQKRLPWHYCPVCTMVCYEEDTGCLECSSPQPAEGWPELRKGLDPWLGRVLDERYLLTQQIGRGATASVYRAESLAIPRQFAVKIIYPNTQPARGPSSSEVMVRLQREVEALGRLRNPHIVRLNDVLELPHRHVAVVMDFVEGDTIEWIVEKNGPLPVKRACTLVRQIANGVYEAHLAGFTHRDLKPENIMVERLPMGDDFVHILDFGIVHVDGEVSMTQGFIGTPLYASPEQALGESVDHRSDIYALGAILFFMLTGQPPFLSQNVMQVLRQHVESRPPRLSEVVSTRRFPEDLETLLSHMLAKDPKQRPQSLAEVMHRLDEHSDGEEVSVAFASTPMEEPTRPGLELPSELRDDPDRHESDPIPMPPPGEMQLFEDSEAVAQSALLERLSEASRASEPREVNPTSIAEDISDPHEFRVPRLAPSSEVRHQLGEDRSSFARVNTESREREDLGAIELPADAKLLPYAFSANFRFLYVHQGALILHSMKDRLLTRLQLKKPEEITALALGKEHALIGRSNGHIDRINIHSGEVERLFESVFSDRVVGVAIGPRDQMMMAVMASGRLYAKPANKDPRDWSRVGNAHTATSMVLSPHAELFAVSRDDRSVDVGQTSNPKQVATTINLQAGVEAMAFSNDGYLLALVLAGGDIALYDTFSGRQLATVPIHQDTVVSCCFSEESTLMTLRTDGRRLYVMRAG